MSSASAPLRVYGSEISYFTGKLEAYLRYKEIPYERIALTSRLFNGLVRRRTGVSQMPAVELPDGRWLTDTTPMIEWFETQHPAVPIFPSDPMLTFVSRLLEDYADEWLWRPALHYRWSYRTDALLLSRRIVDELLPDVPAPGWLERIAIRTRQRLRYVRGDGVTPATRAHVEDTYLHALDSLQAIFERRPFLLGERPSLADFGFFASMFRHFGLDPTPSTLMRLRAPAVYEWLARLWNTRGSRLRDRALLDSVPSDLAPILEEVGSAYLPYLAANAGAWQAGSKHFDVDIQGTPYRHLSTSRYRVWCLQKLQAHFRALAEPAARATRGLLEEVGCWGPLWQARDVDSRYDPDNRAPFAPGLGVFQRS